MPKRVVVVGGGIAGLAAAHTLAREPGIEALVLERGARPGGHLQTERAQGFLLEWGPHGFLDDAPALTALIEDLGLSGRVIRANHAARRRFVVRGGVPRELPGSPSGLLTSNVLSVAERLRVIVEPILPRRKGAGDESVRDFARRRFGAAGGLLADAMVTGVFAGDAARLSAASSFPRVVALEAGHGSVLVGAFRERERLARGRLASFAGGLTELPEALAQALGDRVCTGVGVASVARANGRWTVASAAGEAIEADAVVLACPAWEASTLLAAVDVELPRLLSAISAAPVTVVHLGFRTSDLGHPPEGFGTLVPASEGSNLLGLIAASNVFAARAPEGHTLVTALLRSDAAGDPVDPVRPLLAPRGEPRLARTRRHERAIPQYELGHSARLEAIDARLKTLDGLALTGNSYRGVSVGSAVEDAVRVAHGVLARLL